MQGANKTELTLKGLASIGGSIGGAPPAPILQDSAGHLWVQVMTPKGAALVPWVGGLPPGGGHDAPFMPAHALPDPGPAGGQGANVVSAMQSADGQDSAGGGTVGAAGAKGPPAPAMPQGVEAPFTFSPMEAFLLNEAFKAVAANATGGIDPKGALGSILQNTVGNVPALGMMFANTALGRQTMKLFDGWEIDEATGAPEIMLQQQVKGLAMKAQGALVKRAISVAMGGSVGSVDVGTAVGNAKGKVVEFFGGVSSEAVLEAACLGTPDTMGNSLVATNSSTVLVEGKPIGVVNDMVIPKAAKVLAGAGTVLASKGTLPVARTTSATAVPSVLQKGAPTVFVGGDSAVGAVIPKPQTVDPKTILGLVMNLYADGKGGAFGKGNANRPGEGGLGPGEEGPMPRLGHDQEGEELLDMPGWRLQELMDGDDPETGDYPLGYRAGVFVNDETGETVFVMQGSNAFSLIDPANRADWVETNLGQGTGFVPPQYEQALADTNRLKEMYPDLIVAGHSLGGGLATFAGLAAGTPVAAYNPAGLGTGALATLDALGVESIAPGQVANYITSGEILTGVSTWFGQPAPIGDIYEMPMQQNPSWMDYVPVLNLIEGIISRTENHQSAMMYDIWVTGGQEPVFTGTTPLPVLTSWSPYGH